MGRPYFDPDEIAEAVGKQVEGAIAAGEPIDYLTFVPNGEPTLDPNLGATARALRPMGIPLAVITNGSLLDHPPVRENLMEMNWVSVKVDAVQDGTWRSVDRPHGKLSLPSILAGLDQFAADFSGRLQTETMLLKGLNDGEADLEATASFVEGLRPETAYLSIPTRPAAEPWAKPPTEEALAQAYEIFSRRIQGVEILSGYEGDAFASTGDSRRDLLSITAVHPMRESAVRRTLKATGSEWGVVSDLIESGELVEVDYDGHRYYLRPVGA
jgi:wyosine [tRNA(Phe)-imidazoG37] synthetase (radical SAM superfamily)